MDTREWIDVSTISGNASQELKQSLFDLLSTQVKLNKARGTRGFEPEISSRIEWTEISIVPKAEEPERPEGRVVSEITVEEGAVVLVFSSLGTVVSSAESHGYPCHACLDMLNGNGTIHGACCALLIDKCVSDTIPNPPRTVFFC